MDDRSTSGQARRAFPRYRVEERVPGLADLIVGFADTPTQYDHQLALRTAALLIQRSPAELVVVDQDSDAVILRRRVGRMPDAR